MTESGPKTINSADTLNGGLEAIQSIGDLLTQRQRKRFKAGAVDVSSDSGWNRHPRKNTRSGI